MKRWIIFTDLDGSLLDHHTYSHEPADPMLTYLESKNIPVIIATSKTRSEVIYLKNELKNSHPFIIENGAAVLIPADYFPQMPKGCIEHDNFWVYEFSQPREHWLKLLTKAKQSFPNCFEHFTQMQDAGIAKATGLSLAASKLANERKYSEPIQWVSDTHSKNDFISWLKINGGYVLEGGRFMHLSDHCNKGIALRWTLAQYQAQSGTTNLSSIAIGDSNNDIEMLEAADEAIIIRSPSHPPPTLKRTSEYLLTTLFGPEGWAEGVNKLITD